MLTRAELVATLGRIAGACAGCDVAVTVGGCALVGSCSGWLAFLRARTRPGEEVEPDPSQQSTGLLVEYVRTLQPQGGSGREAGGERAQGGGCEREPPRGAQWPGRPARSPPRRTSLGDGRPHARQRSSSPSRAHGGAPHHHQAQPQPRGAHRLGPPCERQREPPPPGFWDDHKGGREGGNHRPLGHR